MRSQLTAEFLGTFAMVFAGTGAMIVNDVHAGVITHVGISIVWGLVVMAMIYAMGEVSGAHFNPAVTIAFALSGSFPARRIVPYVASQVAGAIAASLVLRQMFGLAGNLGITQPHGPVSQTFWMELILTFFLMLVILSVARGSKEQGLMAGIAIGATVGLMAMFAGPVCNASMNPARSIGPAIVSGHLIHLWLFIAAPLIGASLAVPAWRAMRTQNHATPRHRDTAVSTEQCA
jgi:aquaporin NIP